MSAHTPGPWRVGEGTGYINQTAIEPSIGCVYGKGEECVATAKLIAAAPDLLEACKAAEQWLSGWASAEPYINILRAALVKAVA